MGSIVPYHPGECQGIGPSSAPARSPLFPFPNLRVRVALGVDLMLEDSSYARETGEFWRRGLVKDGAPPAHCRPMPGEFSDSRALPTDHLPAGRPVYALSLPLQGTVGIGS